MEEAERQSSQLPFRMHTYKPFLVVFSILAIILVSGMVGYMLGKKAGSDTRVSHQQTSLNVTPTVTIYPTQTEEVNYWKTYSNQDYSVQYPQNYTVHEQSIPPNVPVNIVAFLRNNDPFGQIVIEKEDPTKITPSVDTIDYITRTLGYYDSTLRRVEQKQLGNNTVYLVTISQQLRDDLPQEAFIRSGDILFRIFLQTGGGGFYAASQIPTYDDFMKLLSTFTSVIRSPSRSD